MTEPIHIISLGAGVQSSTMALMAAVGEITPMPVAAIFADTQAEPRHVYAWLDYLIDKLPFPVRRVSKGNLLTDTLSERENGEFLRIDIPAYVFTNGVADGFINRSCTRDYKIKPIISEARSMVGGASMLQWRRAHKASLELLSEYKKEEKRARKEKRKAPQFPFAAWTDCQSDPLVVQWIGISLDEISRCKESREPWIKNIWPLIDKRMSRHNCLRWMESRGYPEPPKSSCTFCPYHSNAQWRALDPKEFAECVDLDRRLRTTTNGKTVRLTGELYLHKSGKPLSEVDLSTEEERGQLNMFNNECEGMCGV